jgi:hypothetical protein
MMGRRQVEQGVLFYNFSLDAHVPADHLLRSIDRFVDLWELRRELAPFYSTLGRPCEVADVPKKEVGRHKRHVRFEPVKRLSSDIATRPPCARSGRLA